MEDLAIFPIHSFQGDACLDKRIRTEIDQIGRNITVSFDSFRFRQVNTSEQQQKIACKLTLQEKSDLNYNLNQCTCFTTAQCGKL